MACKQMMNPESKGAKLTRYLCGTLGDRCEEQTGRQREGGFQVSCVERRREGVDKKLLV